MLNTQLFIKGKKLSRWPIKPVYNHWEQISSTKEIILISGGSATKNFFCVGGYQTSFILRKCSTIHLQPQFYEWVFIEVRPEYGVSKQVVRDISLESKEK